MTLASPISLVCMITDTLIHTQLIFLHITTSLITCIGSMVHPALCHFQLHFYFNILIKDPWCDCCDY